MTAHTETSIEKFTCGGYCFTKIMQNLLSKTLNYQDLHIRNILEISKQLHLPSRAGFKVKYLRQVPNKTSPMINKKAKSNQIIFSFCFKFSRKKRPHSLDTHPQAPIGRFSWQLGMTVTPKCVAPMCADIAEILSFTLTFKNSQSIRNNKKDVRK